MWKSTFTFNLVDEFKGVGIEVKNVFYGRLSIIIIF